MLRTIIVCLFAAVHGGFCPDTPLEMDHADDVQPVPAPVFYDRTLLIASTPTSVSVIIFRPLEKKDNVVGASYRFRMLVGGKEVKGDGKVFENIKRMTDDTTGKTLLFDLGSERFVRTGKLSLRWSPADTASGWIMYFPENCRLQVGSSEDFERINLNRFRWRCEK